MATKINYKKEKMECKIMKSDLYEIIQKAYPVVPLKSSLQILYHGK
jgi:hypothetical protein